MILTIRTDTPIAQLSVMQNGQAVADETWEAGRQLAQDLLLRIDSLVKKTGAGWSDIEGVAVFSGPGSFTGLRIGVTVANTIAYARSVPIAGCGGEKWQAECLARLASGESDGIVLPVYGAEPNITV